jgi:hypothetical protein
MKEQIARVFCKRLGWLYAVFTFDTVQYQKDQSPNNIRNNYYIIRNYWSMDVYYKHPMEKNNVPVKHLTPTEYALVWNDAITKFGIDGPDKIEVPINTEIVHIDDPLLESPLYKTLKETADKITVHIDAIEKRLNAPVLVEHAWLLTRREPLGQFDLIYGTGYQNQPERCFRFQRSPVLDGVILFSKESAENAVAQLKKNDNTVKMLHMCNYLKLELERLTFTLKTATRAMNVMRNTNDIT